MGLSPVVSRSCGRLGRTEQAESLNQALQLGHALALRPRTSSASMMSSGSREAATLVN